jgi:hypothetical protein
MPNMTVVSLLAVWEKYVLALQARKAFVPAPPSMGVAAVSDRGDFCAGVCLFPADRLVVAEFLVTNPEVHMWERHAGVVAGAQAIVTYGKVSGKTPMFLIRHKGLERAIQRAGFSSNGAVVWLA